MAKEFVNPNLHVVWVHFPLALLVMGTLVELFSFLYRRHAFRAAGRWMIFLGALAGIPTAMSGIYALADVTRIGLSQEESVGPWREVAARSPVWQNPEQAHMLRDHVVLQSWGAGVAVLACVVWIGASDVWRARLHLPLLAVLVISSGLTIAGAWHAGEAVYRHGTGVELEPATQPSMADVARQQGAAPAEQERAARGWEYFLPPVQVHVISAGLTVALAMAALALSFRAANSAIPRTEVDNIAAALGPPPAEPTARDIDRELNTPRRRGDPQDAHPRVPSTRFWLLTFLIGALTALGGWWVLAADSDAWKPKELWELARMGENATKPWLTRRLAHVGGGGSIVVLSLLMAFFSRVAPRSKFLLLILALLLLAAVAAQIWMGVLLTYDTIHGPVTRFN